MHDNSSKHMKLLEIYQTILINHSESENQRLGAMTF